MAKKREKYRTILLLLLLSLPLCELWAQVSICYDFESATPNSRPVGWGALPNYDFHYVGVTSAIAHTGGKSIGNNGTTCYTIMPDEGLNYGTDSVWLTFWYYLHNNTDFFDVGYLTNPDDSTSFHLLTTVHEWSKEWHFCAVDLSSVPTGARIAFFGHDIFSSDGTFWLDDIHLTSSPCAAWGLRVAENRPDSVRLEWESAGNPTVTLTINWNTPYNVTGNSFTFARNYYQSFMSELVAQCPYSDCMPIQPYSSMFIPRYREEQCIDVTDFNSYSYSSYSSMAVPFYGTPVEPYLHTGFYTTTAPGVSGVFAGSHTINTNPGSDGGGMMVFPRTIPPGDNTTLRLGNRLGDWESASVLYTITVDTNVNDYLLMKYTVAMAFGSFQGTDEAHRNDTLHPAWFRIELLDDTLGQMQSESCNQFYIDMWDTAGWDEMNSMYKRRDFTGMAIDLRPYHGQQLHLRVTTCDGAVNNRWCYAYYNFECLKRYQVLGDCLGDSALIKAPYGFHYRWWRDGDSSTLATSQNITVPADGTLYHCQLTDRFHAECADTLSRFALAGPYVLASDTVVENDLPYTFRGISFSHAVDTMFTVPSDVGCDTVVRFILHVWPNQSTRIERRVCPGDWPLVWQGYTFAGPDSVTLTLTDIHGADSIVTFVATQAPIYDTSLFQEICPGMPFVYDSIDYGGPVSFDLLLATVDGCDSLVHVTLAWRDSTFRAAAYHSIDSLQWSNTVPIALCANQTLYVVDSSQDASSLMWHLEGGDSISSLQTQFAFAGTDSVESLELSLVATSQGGCRDTLRWPVMVFPLPVADFEWTPESPVDLYPEVQLINQTQPTDCEWLWMVETVDGGMDSLTVFSPVYRWQGTLHQSKFDVTLQARLTRNHDTVVHTCSDTATHTIVIVTCYLSFPNVVTPNGDGINDRWEIVNLVEMGLYPVNELWIYNRWGKLVYHARDINHHAQFWNPDNPLCPDGTYFFHFKAHGDIGSVDRCGVIEVLR